MRAGFVQLPKAGDNPNVLQVPGNENCGIFIFFKVLLFKRSLYQMTACYLIPFI